MFDRLPFIVRKIETLNGANGPAEIAGRFMRQVSAEAFVQAEIFKFATRGSDTGALWGRNGDGTGARFWIEIDQEALAEFDPGI